MQHIAYLAIGLMRNYGQHTHTHMGTHAVVCAKKKMAKQQGQQTMLLMAANGNPFYKKEKQLQKYLY